MLAAYGVLGTMWSVAKRGLGPGTPAVASACLLALAILGLAWRSRDGMERALTRLAVRVTAIPWTRWTAVVVVLAISARLAWFLALPAEPVSDGRTYLHLSQRLLEVGTYGFEGARAFWPPGFPFGLIPSVALLGPTKEAVLAHNIALTVALLVYVGLLARRYVGDGSSRLVVLAVAIWPEFITAVGVASKELQVAVFLAGATYHALRAAASFSGGAAIPLGHALLAGLLIGGAALTQPGTLLLIVAVAIAWLILRSGRRLAWTAALAALLGLCVVLAPWTVRNFQVFGEFVLVSTNGGGVAYRSNHDEATGGYVILEEPYASYGEPAQSRMLMQDAQAWILEHPVDFAELAVAKQLLFLGEWGYGAFWTLHQLPGVSDTFHVGVRFLLTLMGAVLYATLMARLVAGRWRGHIDLPLIVAGTWAYFFLIHSVFEAGSRHLLPVLPLLIVIAFGQPKDPTPSATDRVAA